MVSGNVTHDRAGFGLQLLRAVQRAKQQRMQSQDCVRIMASSAAAAEARARQLQEALSAVCSRTLDRVLCLQCHHKGIFMLLS